MRAYLNKIAVAACVGMFIVLMMGALVTKTDSGRGCGDDWPLCNGKFVPAYTIDSMIEYSHRSVTATEGILVALTLIGTFRYVKRRDARFYASTAALFIIIQSIMGALAVKFPTSAAVMALHFGLSLIAFAATFMLCFVLIRRKDKDGKRVAKGDLSHYSAPAPYIQSKPSIKAWIWISLIVNYIVVYLGAFVKHRESSGGCLGWPLCNGEVIPEMTGPTGIVFTHRVASLIMLFVILYVFYIVRKNNGHVLLKKLNNWVVFVMILQILSGAFVTLSIATDWYLLFGMFHAVLISALFGLQCYMVALGIQFNKKQTA